MELEPAVAAALVRRTQREPRHLAGEHVQHRVGRTRRGARRPRPRPPRPSSRAAVLAVLAAPRLRPAPRCRGRRFHAGGIAPTSTTVRRIGSSAAASAASSVAPAEPVRGSLSSGIAAALVEHGAERGDRRARRGPVDRRRARPRRRRRRSSRSQLSEKTTARSRSDANFRSSMRMPSRLARCRSPRRAARRRTSGRRGPPTAARTRGGSRPRRAPRRAAGARASTGCSARIRWAKLCTVPIAAPSRSTSAASACVRRSPGVVVVVDEPLERLADPGAAARSPRPR